MEADDALLIIKSACTHGTAVRLGRGEGLHPGRRRED
jgi:hypothetical protein